MSSDPEIRATDFLGQEYGVGDYVVYATTSGCSPVQKLARVEKIYYKPVRSSRWNRDERRYEYDEEQELKVGVRELKNGRNFSRWDGRTWNEDTRTYDEDLSKVRVTYPMSENIVLVAYAGEGEAP